MRQADWLSIWQHIMSSQPGVCTGLGLAMHNTFRHFQLEAFCLHLVFLPDQEAQHSFTLHFMDTCYSHLLPPGLSLQEFLPPDQQPTSPVSVPFRAAKDLPHPPKSLSCHRSSTIKNHLRQAKGIYCLSFEKSFALRRVLQGARRDAHVHINCTTGNRRKDTKGAPRCPHRAVFSSNLGTAK